MLVSLSQKTKAGIGLSETNGIGRPHSGFFMRKTSQFFIIMSGWVGSRKAGRSVCPVCQPTQSGAMFDIMLPGLKPLQTDHNHEHTIKHRAHARKTHKNPTFYQ
jgi:hypothetical protein